MYSYSMEELLAVEKNLGILMATVVQEADGVVLSQRRQVR